MAEAGLKHRKIASKPYVPKYSAIVMDADTGKILEQEDAHGIRHPASLTKMMSLYLAFEALQSGRLSLNTKMIASTKASRQAPTKLGLLSGEQITVYQAIMGLITKSANDAAVVLAEHLTGSEEAFARRMTQKAQSLGMTKTIFKNASGLPNPSQVTCAYDMAILSRALYRDFPQQYKYFKNQSFTHKGTVHRNHNHLLGKVEGLDGIKTGFVNASGFNLAASAVRYDAAQRPHRLITVVLGGPNRHWRDRRVTELLEINFQKMGLSGNTSRLPKVTQLVMQTPAGRQEILEDEQDAFTQLAVETEDFDEAANTSAAFNKLIETVAKQDITINNAGTSKSIAQRTQVKPAAWVVPVVSKEIGTTKQKKKKRIDHLTVQLGTYRNQQIARRYAQKARALIGNGQAQTIQTHKGKKKLVASQVVGLNKSQAKSLCHKLQQKGQKCLILN